MPRVLDTSSDKGWVLANVCFQFKHLLSCNWANRDSLLESLLDRANKKRLAITAAAESELSLDDDDPKKRL